MQSDVLISKPCHSVFLDKFDKGYLFAKEEDVANVELSISSPPCAANQIVEAEADVRRIIDQVLNSICSKPKIVFNSWMTDSFIDSTCSHMCHMQ